jgi:hypothetical protein
MTSNPKTTTDASPAAERFFNRQITWRDAAGQREVWVPVGYLPAGVEFGDDFPEPIRYDATLRRLSYRGLMPHASYAFLRSLSADLPYQIAIERLFIASSPPAVHSETRAKWLAAAAAIAAALLVVCLSVGNFRRQEPLEQLIDSVDESDVMVDADTEDDPARSPADSPQDPTDDDVGNG